MFVCVRVHNNNFIIIVAARVNTLLSVLRITGVGNKENCHWPSGLKNFFFFEVGLQKLCCRPER